MIPQIPETGIPRNSRRTVIVDVTKILADLRAERAQIQEAILSLERLARGRGNRRGRPPSWLSADMPQVEPPKRRGRPPGSKNKTAPAALSAGSSTV